MKKLKMKSYCSFHCISDISNPILSTGLCNKQKMQDFLSKKNPVIKLEWTHCVINFIESILDHIDDSTICVWGDNDDFDAMSTPISRTNRVIDRISSEMKRGGYPLDHWFKAPEDQVPWTLLGTNPVFIAIVIVLNLHIFDQKSEMFKLINYQFVHFTPNSFATNQPFELLKKCLEKVPNKIVRLLETKSLNLFRAYGQKIYQITGWQYLEMELKKLKKMMSHIQCTVLQDIQESERRQEDQIVLVQELEITESEEYIKYEKMIIRAQWVFNPYPDYRLLKRKDRKVRPKN